MNVDFFRTADVFDVLADEWDNILDDTRSELFFVTLDYQRTWWEHLARGDLAVIAVRDDDNVLRGIAPWFIEQIDGEHVVHFVGCIEVSDYLDFVVMPGYEEPVFNALIEFMLSEQAPQWDRFALCNIHEQSPTINCLEDTAQKYGLTFSKEQAEVCPVIQLADDYEAYLVGLDKKQRHELRRKRRRAEARDVEWYIVDDEHNLEQEIEKFMTLMAMSTTEKAEFLKMEGHQAFFRDLGYVMYERGNLALIFLTIDDHPVATMWQFIFGDRTLLYNSGLNQTDYGAYSPGIVLLTYSVEDAINRGLRQYDFLRGDEQYKYRMGAEDTAIYTLHIRR